MAIIGKIRSYSVLLIIVIGVALAAFVLGDLFKSTGPGKMPPLAEINGQEITINEFREKVEEMEQRMQQQSRTGNLNADQRFQAMQTAWQELLMSEIMMEEYEELGLAVKHSAKRKPSISKDELGYLLTSQDAHPYIKQIPGFQDQQTGQFNPALVSQFISSLQDQEHEIQMQWSQLEREIKKERLRTKYYNLIQKGYYLPGQLAAQYYKEEAQKANTVVVGALYRNVPDSAIAISDADYEAYYEEHKKEFEADEPTAKISYLTYNVTPSRDDFNRTREEAMELYNELTNAKEENVPYIVNSAGGDNRFDSTYYMKGDLPMEIDTALFNAEPGYVVPVYQKDGAFHTARLMKIAERPDSMRASHILIMHNQIAQPGNVTRTRDEAKKIADSLLNVVQNDPAQFEQIASSVSEDEVAAQNQGDLDWFKDQEMVPAFNEAVIKHDEGEMFKVESQFGYHVVKVTGKKDPVKKILVARVSIPIEPTAQTFDSVYVQASQFAGNYRTQEAFEEAVREQQMEPRERTLQRMEGNIPGLGSAREIVQWAFDEKTEVGTVSKVFDVEDAYVVVLLEERTEAGIPKLDDVRESIKGAVATEVRARLIKERFNKYMNGDVDLMTLAREANAQIDTIPELSFSTYSIPTFGPEPKLIGRVMSSPEGKVVGPVQGNMGVYVYKVLNYIPAPQTDNYARIRQQKQNHFNMMVTGRDGIGQVFEALKDVSEIEDNRILYY